MYAFNRKIQNGTIEMSFMRKGKLNTTQRRNIKTNFIPIYVCSMWNVSLRHTSYIFYYALLFITIIIIVVGTFFYTSLNCKYISFSYFFIFFVLFLIDCRSFFYVLYSIPYTPTNR